MRLALAIAVALMLYCPFPAKDQKRPTDPGSSVCKAYFIVAEQDAITVNLPMVGLNDEQAGWYKKHGGEFPTLCLVSVDASGKRVVANDSSAFDFYVDSVVGTSPLYRITWEQHRVVPGNGVPYTWSASGILSLWDQRTKDFVPVSPLHNTNHTNWSSSSLSLLKDGLKEISEREQRGGNQGKQETPSHDDPDIRSVSEASTKPKHYDHGSDESSFGLAAHVKATEQRGSRCLSTVDIGNSEVEVYNFENAASCLGFTNLSAGMSFKARFSLICEGSFDQCTMKNVEGAQAGILIYLPPTVPGADAIIQEYKIVSTREIPNSPQVSTPQPTAQGTFGLSSDGNQLVRHDGVAVSQVVAGGPADQAGIKAGDVILAIDDLYLFTIEELKNAIARCKPGSKIRLRYRRYTMINETQLIVGSQEATVPQP